MSPAVAGAIGEMRDYCPISIRWKPCLSFSLLLCLARIMPDCCR